MARELTQAAYNQLARAYREANTRLCREPTPELRQTAVELGVWLDAAERLELHSPLWPPLNHLALYPTRCPCCSREPWKYTDGSGVIVVRLCHGCGHQWTEYTPPIDQRFEARLRQIKRGEAA